MAELVYRRTIKGIAGEIWHVPQRHNDKPKETLARHALTDEQALMRIDELRQLFPPPHITTEDGTKLELK